MILNIGKVFSTHDVIDLKDLKKEKVEKSKK